MRAPAREFSPAAPDAPREPWRAEAGRLVPASPAQLPGIARTTCQGQRSHFDPPFHPACAGEKQTTRRRRTGPALAARPEGRRTPHLKRLARHYCARPVRWEDCPPDLRAAALRAAAHRAPRQLSRLEWEAVRAKMLAVAEAYPAAASARECRLARLPRALVPRRGPGAPRLRLAFRVFRSACPLARSRCRQRQAMPWEWPLARRRALPGTLRAERTTAPARRLPPLASDAEAIVPLSNSLAGAVSGHDGTGEALIPFRPVGCHHPDERQVSDSGPPAELTAAACVTISLPPIHRFEQGCPCAGTCPGRIRRIFHLTQRGCWP